MEWLPDPSAGAWLRDRLDDPWDGSMHGVVPRGYAAYARVFHPASVRTGPDAPDEPATWATAAEAFGTVLHPLAQWQSIVRTPPGEDWNQRIAPDGREFAGPDSGQLPADRLTAVAALLRAHTETPDAGVAALWEGWGGLLGHLGHSPARSFFEVSDDPVHQKVLESSFHDPFNTVFRKPTWQDGILSREISESPRLELPGRAYVLFAAAADEFADPDWVLAAPWRDLPAERHGFPPSAYGPSILWPEDRAWVLVSEIDFDSTIVAGSAELIAAVCADPGLEAMPVPEGARLTWDADEVNG